jgi:hypothetical protein
MKKLLAVLMKVFLLGIFAFGMSVSLVFADEIKDSSPFLNRYNYIQPNGSLDWDTFYRRMDQYAARCTYYSVEITDVYASVDIKELFMIVIPNGFRFIYTDGYGLMVTMWLNYQPTEGWGKAQNFTDYASAERFWNNALDIVK